VSHVAGLKGDLLIAYGTGDDNCHFQNCAVLIDALVAHDKHFETCIYPNRTHGIAKGENTRNHLFSALTRFFARTVPSMQSA
jgi:dipeptidyl-peptidase-4